MWPHRQCIRSWQLWRDRHMQGEQELPAAEWNGRWTPHSGSTQEVQGPLCPAGLVGKVAECMVSMRLLVHPFCSLAPCAHSHTAYCNDSRNQLSLYEGLHIWSGGAEHMLFCLCSLYSVSRDVTPTASTGTGWYCMCYGILQTRVPLT